MAAPPGLEENMSFHEQIIFKEAQTWEVLKQSGQSLLPFLAPDCVMIFPGGTIFDSQSRPALQEILDRPDLKPWTEYEMKDVRVIPLGQEAAMICYSVEAERKGEPAYHALISSVWRRTGDTWEMCLHQQTPVHV